MKRLRVATYSNGWVGPMKSLVFGNTAYQRWAYTKASTPAVRLDRCIHGEDDRSELIHGLNCRICFWAWFGDCRFRDHLLIANGGESKERITTLSRKQRNGRLDFLKIWI